ncbi:hypothetical protein SAMN04488100_13133 [Alkalibacterium putridalgicola]|uniref:Uncharacterized protein n=1 Tax=Alkalibacterium putridalgicola TaxID=426703 RepID=A0A1H7W7X4_9LACT|nr:hypothetical protein APU01nite_20310 [Alkalibacterium putridalgicola]SEM17600.1 hypothetical protein SAMN04488100_13133 [Alkalibacterium putridalgicola]
MPKLKVYANTNKPLQMPESDHMPIFLSVKLLVMLPTALIILAVMSNNLSSLTGTL